VEREGRSKTVFDLVIAWPALEHGATRVTNDSALRTPSRGEVLARLIEVPTAQTLRRAITGRAKFALRCGLFE